MARKITNGGVARVAAGLLAVAVGTWVCARISIERVFRHTRAEVVPPCPPTVAPRESATPLQPPPDVRRAVRRAEERLRSWFARESPQPVAAPAP
jgi:hypothetical protein